MTSSSPSSSSSDETSGIAAETAAAVSAGGGEGGGPGRAVRGAREAAGLSLEALAAQTRLARATLDALERDDFKTLNEPVYVKGYYRKCAKVLGLSDVELIAAYERQVGPKQPAAPTKLLLAADRGLGKGSARGGGWRWLWILVVAGLIGGAAYWLRGNSSAIVLDNTSGSGETRVLANQAAVPAVLPHPVPPPSTDSAPVSAAASPSAEPAPVAASPAVTAESKAPTNVPPAPAAVEPAASAADAPEGAESALGEGSLVLSFKGTSWVRIEDANGKMLLSGVIQAGDHQVVHGKPPYSVFLGNAPGVSLVYDGQPFDVTAYIKQNSTARFSVPQ
jgi:cytoskeleton protein RodZ